MKKALIALAAAFIAVFTFADGESLAETGGFVTTTAQLAFKGITLNDLGTTVFPCANMGGLWIGEAVRGSAAAFCNRTAGTDATGEYVRYEVQIRDGGSAKVVAVKFRRSGGDVTVQAVATGYSTANGAVDIDFTSALTDGRWDVQLATAADADGYGVFGLKLAQPEDFSSINVNFTYTNSAELVTSDIAGAPGFAVPGPYWTQKKGVVATYNTVNILGMVDGAYVQSQLPGSTLAISGTRGTWANGTTYAAATDIRYGYIDENEYNTTPTVTISNVPFEFYKVVVYSSTDNTDVQFGYVTVNGVGYCSANASTNDTQAYATAEGTQSWGKSSVAGYLEGVNYLVTPVLKATDARTVAVVGHKVASARGCIAAIQIVKATAPEIAATAITAADINAAVPSGESVLKIPADATITLDAALTASKVKFVCSGKVTLSADSRPSAEELAKLDFTYVRGAVLRPWLTPGVVGFNFNANGGLSNVGTANGAADTSLALEIGEWHANASDASGTSSEMFSDGLSTLTWKSANVYAESGNLENGTFIQGYLDDGNGGVQITLSAVPYETYDVIIYCSTDKDNSDKGFKAKTVNGTIYTWNATAGEVTTTSDVNAKWGLASQAAGKAVYGANTIRINGLTGSLSILGGTNSNGARGCISAIQIMPAGTSTAPTMTVGTDGEATAAAWTDSTLWEGGVIPSSGTAKIVVAGDVTLTIDDSVSLSAVTVEGSGSLKLVKGDGATVSFDSLSSAAVQIVLPDTSISIPTLSAPIKYLYKTETIASTAAGNTYTQGAGTSEAAVTIAHNGGLATLTGGTYYLGESMNATATMVDFVDATAVYSSSLSVGMATYIIEGTSSITTPRIVLSNGGAGRTAVMTLKDTASLTVTGGVDGDTNQGNMFGHYAGPSTFTIQDSATFTSSDYIILIGRTGNTQTINVNGGVFTAKGLMLSGYASGTNTLNLNGGVLALGERGIGTYGASRTMAVNVLGASEVRATAATLPVTQAVTLSAPVSFTKASGVEAATVTLASVSGAGAISIGAGVTLDIGKNRPTGEITVDDDGVLAVTMTDKSDAPVFKVSAQPKNIVLRAPDDATEYAVEYDADAGTITIKPPRPIWTAKEDSAFGTAGNWSTGALPENGQDAAVNFAADTDMTVSGTYTLGDLAFTGSGNATVSGEGSIVASSYDFSATTGRIEYNLPTGAGSIAAGADTVLMQNGSGELVIAPDTKLTLAAPWGTIDGDTATYTGGFTPKDRSTLIIAPGEGMIQKTTQSVLWQYQLTTIAVSNGTLAVNVGNGGTGYFAGNSVRIDDGGTISLEVQDASGYNQTAAPITVNAGGTLAVKVRDTLRRPLVMNGGTVTVQGQESGRALDLYDNDTITVTANSTIQAIDDGTEQNPIIAFRKNTTVVNIDDGISLVNNVTYGTSESGTVTIRGTMNNGNGNGSMVMNGFNGNPLVFTGLTTIGESGKPVMYVLNCEHENGTYVVNAGSRIMGSGSITGNGGVTLAAANSKICGSLTVNNVTAASGGTYGDQWNSVAAKIVGSFFATNGIQTVQNGSLTIGKDCVVTNAAGTANTTAASFSIAANGNLRIEKDLTVAGLTVADCGTITLVGSKSNIGWDVPELTVAREPSYPGTVNVVLDFSESNPPAAFEVKLPTGVTAQNVTVRDSKGQRKWRVAAKGDGLYATSDGGFRLIIR